MNPSQQRIFTHDTEADKVRLRREAKPPASEVTVAIAEGYTRACPECGQPQPLELRTTYKPGDAAVAIYDQPKCVSCRHKPKAP